MRLCCKTDAGFFQKMMQAFYIVWDQNARKYGSCSIGQAATGTPITTAVTISTTTWTATTAAAATFTHPPHISSYEYSSLLLLFLFCYERRHPPPPPMLRFQPSSWPGDAPVAKNPWCLRGSQEILGCRCNAGLRASEVCSKLKVVGDPRHCW